MSRIVYKLNGYNLNELGIIVKSADGLIDLPELKKRAEYNWPDMHGKIIDTRRPYFDTRKITLDCAWPIEPRGCNLFPNTETRHFTLFGSPTVTFEDNQTVEEWDTEKAIRATGSKGTSSIYGTYQSPTNQHWGAKQYVVSIYIKNLGQTRVAITQNGNSTNRCVWEVGEEGRKFFVVGNNNTAYNMGFNFIDPDGSEDYEFDFMYWHPKIEEGTTQTEWTPNPADLGLDAATEGGTFNIQTAEEMVREKLLLLGELVRLEVHFDSKILVKPLIYNVIQDKGITFGRKFSGADVLLFFKITLIEPQPCKIVLESKKTRGSYTRATSSIGFTPNGAVFDVDWGDGSTVYDIGSGSTLPITHTYSGDGTFYVIISGDVAAITNLTKSNDFAELWTLK